MNFGKNSHHLTGPIQTKPRAVGATKRTTVSVPDAQNDSGFSRRVKKDYGKTRRVFGEETNLTSGASSRTSKADQPGTKLPKGSKPTATVKPSVRTSKTATTHTAEQRSKLPTRSHPVTKKPTKFDTCKSDIGGLVQYVDTSLPVGVCDVDSEANDVLCCRDYAVDVINYARNLEEQCKIPREYLEKCPVKKSARGILMDWLVQVQNHLRMEQETLHLTVAMIDHFLSRKPVSLAKVQLVAITSLLIAAKYNERFAPSIEKLLHLTDDSYIYNEVIKMELLVLKVLGFGLSLPTPILFLERGLKVIGSGDRKLELLSRYLLDLALPDFKILQFSPSMTAAGAIYLAKLILQFQANDSDRMWIKSLGYYLGYKENDIVDCAKRFAKLLSKTEGDRFEGARVKYEHSSYDGVSKWTVLENNPVINSLAGCEEISRETAV